ncbi:MAG: hypothetical protein CMO66_01305 [Verrucomicrobiales bacterium]|nr:hypothetical protein [Verrucomicrobiales bacterium]
MAKVKPFRALRPSARLAAEISAPPYDVLSTAEARAMAEGNDLSFLHVSKPEIDLPEGVDPYSAEVYAKGAENFQRMQAEGLLALEGKLGFYLYRQVMGEHSQTGLVALADCGEYVSGGIKKHELTRPAKEDDRVRHMEALDSQTGLVFLTYRAVTAIDSFVEERTAATADYDFVAADGVRHVAWSVTDEMGISFLEDAFATVDVLYIADGHHRSAAAARIYGARDGAGGSGGFITVIFPDHQMQILAYNRVVKDFNGLSSVEFLTQLEDVLHIVGEGQPEGKHEVSLYTEGTWRRLRFRDEVRAGGRAEDRLDVALLQEHVLEPILGIQDPRTSERIDFVGGIRGATELEQRVDDLGWACAFAMHPTSIDDLLAVADGGGLMPPKSTWFEPKLRDGLFCHSLAD